MKKNSCLNCVHFEKDFNVNTSNIINKYASKPNTEFFGKKSNFGYCKLDNYSIKNYERFHGVTFHCEKFEEK
jgi:hypothetical protein